MILAFRSPSQGDCQEFKVRLGDSLRQSEVKPSYKGHDLKQHVVRNKTIK